MALLRCDHQARPPAWWGSKEVTDYTGINEERMVELHEHLRRTGYCRIEKSDLGNVLPHGGWLVRPTALDNDKRYCRIESDMHALWVEERGEKAAERMSCWPAPGPDQRPA